MSANALIGAACKVVAQARTEYNDDSEAAIDFGTPNDIYLPDHMSGEYHNSRLLIVMTVDAGSGTTDELAVKIYDDVSDTFATAQELTDAGSAATAEEGRDWDHAVGLGPEAASGNRDIVMSVKPRPDRPYLRVALEADGDADTFVVHTVVLLIPGSI